jgi:hypothetical protein
MKRLDNKVAIVTGASIRTTLLAGSLFGLGLFISVSAIASFCVLQAFLMRELLGQSSLVRFGASTS